MVQNNKGIHDKNIPVCYKKTLSIHTEPKVKEGMSQKRPDIK